MNHHTFDRLPKRLTVIFRCGLFTARRVNLRHITILIKLCVSMPKGASTDSSLKTKLSYKTSSRPIARTAWLISVISIPLQSQSGVPTVRCSGSSLRQATLLLLSGCLFRCQRIPSELHRDTSKYKRTRSLTENSHRFRCC